MKKLIIVILLSTSFSAFADEKMDLVLQMLQVTEAKKNHELVIDSYITNFSKNPAMDNDQFKNYFRQAMSWDALIDPMTKIYMESYTTEELQALVDFFGSPIGQSFIKKSPEVNQKSVAVMSENIQKAMSILQGQQ
ncbi:DUF2059 domain-containing protein [Motilimonas sp. E26]|uniref:DUF2059 domain-containing protein n=1 Tax=Motilimonas sp. E26 TaxID=2865674 RepID=UPI001E42F665|nr:DUF2059 domain-containing protein [Motilimonas sp. E26]MCE0559424.1 DUF2059 domain-containing protein [Motilimonas sp. E26]